MAEEDYSTSGSEETRLRQLLFGRELSLLGNLEGRVGTDPAMRESVRRVLVDALREAGVHDHERLSGVLAPLVLSSLREEIRNSRDLMVDALYPITGRLVKTAVQNAFKELIENLNQRLDDSFSAQRWQARITARMRGVSEAEILLRKNPPFHIQEIIILHRSTGLLITRTGGGHLEESHLEDASEDSMLVDDDLVGGMLTAIIAFTKDALGGDEVDGELNTLAFGDSELCLRMSPAIILAVPVRGTRPPGFEAALEELFTGILEQWGETLRKFDGTLPDDQALELVSDMRKRFRLLKEARDKGFQQPSRKGTFTLIGIGALLAAWLLFTFYQDWERQSALDRAQAFIQQDSRLTGYPLRVGYDPQGNLAVEGVVPNSTVLAELQTGLEQRLSGRTLTFRVAASPRGEIAELAGRLGTVASGLEETRIEEQHHRQHREQETRNWREGQQDSLESAFGRVEEARNQLNRRLAVLEKEFVAPDRLLINWVSRNIILFGDKVDFANPEIAEAKFSRLTTLLLGSSPGLKLVVVGYTDRSGRRSINKRLSLARAAVVVDRLVAMGVPETRLLSTGRSTEKMVAAGEGAGNPNRRVEFELIE